MRGTVDDVDDVFRAIGTSESEVSERTTLGMVDDRSFD